MQIRKKAPPGTYTAKEPVNVAGMRISQKVYRLHGFLKYYLLFFTLLFSFLLAAAILAIGWSLVTGRPGVWLVAIEPVICASVIIAFAWLCYRVWSLRLEFSSDGVTLNSPFFSIYAPWENIVAFDKDARAPVYKGSYGAFIYKEPALLYVPLRKGKEEQITVVQIPRLRARTNPDLIAYLSHYLPLLPEVFPEKELTTLLSAGTNKTGEN
jgi:hypothetical protein